MIRFEGWTKGQRSRWSKINKNTHQYRSWAFYHIRTRFCQTLCTEPSGIRSAQVPSDQGLGSVGFILLVWLFRHCFYQMNWTSWIWLFPSRPVVAPHRQLPKENQDKQWRRKLVHLWVKAGRPAPNTCSVRLGRLPTKPCVQVKQVQSSSTVPSHLHRWSQPSEEMSSGPFKVNKQLRHETTRMWIRV